MPISPERTNKAILVAVMKMPLEDFNLLKCLIPSNMKKIAIVMISARGLLHMIFTTYGLITNKMTNKFFRRSFDDCQVNRMTPARNSNKQNIPIKNGEKLDRFKTNNR